MIRCLQVFYSLGLGGAETIMVNYIKAMSSLKIQFDFLLHVNSQNGYEDEIERLGYKIYYTNPMHVKGLFHYVKDMEKLIKENGPYDVVHIHMDSLGGIVALAAKMAGIKHIICHSHSTGVKKTGNCVLLICRALFRLCNVQRVACGSAAGMALFGKRKYVILNNSIDVKGYAHLNESDFIAIRKELNIPIEAKVVVHVGRFDKAKNQMYVVQLADVILKDNPNVYFVFAGTGIMFEEVKQAAAKLENADNFRFLGLRMDIPRILCASDVFVMPSLYEGFPVSMIEAQCAGLPCIVSSNITHEADCKKCKTAYLPFDIDMWKEKIESFIAKNDGKIDRDIAIKAIKDSKFDISDNIVTLCDLYGVAHDDER